MADREQAAERVFTEALSLRPERRPAFLDQICRGAPEVRQMVEDLLRENERLGSFLAEPLLREGSPSPLSMKIPMDSPLRDKVRARQAIKRRDGETLLQHKIQARQMLGARFWIQMGAQCLGRPSFWKASALETVRLQLPMTTGLFNLAGCIRELRIASPSMSWISRPGSRRRLC